MPSPHNPAQRHTSHQARAPLSVLVGLQATLDTALRAADTGRAMSQDNVEVVRRGYEAFNRGDLEDMAAAAAPEFEYVATGVIPGAGGVYRGREEYLRFLEQWWSEFDEPTVDVNELADAGEQVLASVTFRGGGKQSRVETTWSLWQLWSVRDGKFVRGQGFTSREEALEAVGMRE